MADQTGQGVPADGQTPEVSLEALIKENKEYKQFFDGVTPLLEKLNPSPDLVQAILAGKIDDSYAKAALAGTLTVKDAEVATAAAAAVEKEIGTKAFSTTSPEELSKLVEEKVSALEAKLTDKDDMRQFESYTNQFISDTPDFTQYSTAIAEWLDEHDITDVKVAYYAVKGELSEKQAKEAAEADAAENAKNVMLNASGGGISANAIVGGQPFIDSLIASRPNPNRF